MSNKLHIVSLENPFPPDYGGVMGIFNRIRALHQSGLEIHLHVFYHDRQPKKELENFCHKVYYYKRDMRKSLLLSKFPFIVASRGSKQFLKNIQLIEAPILFEGIHTCLYLNHASIENRIRLVRMHNVEHDYYHHLALAEKNIFKKWYLKRESIKLKKFEAVLANCNRILSVVESDQAYFENNYHNSELIPVFIDENRFHFDTIQIEQVVYHGNLSVAENSLAAEWLIKNVFSKITHDCIIAGKNPTPSLVKLVANTTNVTLIPNPSFDDLNDIVRRSAVCLLPTFQATGIKLKLIDTLMQGRHCIVNSMMLNGTTLNPFCKIAESPEDFCREINNCIPLLFTESDFEQRKLHLKDYFNNERSVKRIKELIRVSAD